MLSQFLCYRDNKTTYEIHAVCILVVLDEFVDRPVLHPARNHQTPFLAKRNTNQRKDIGVLEVSPDHRLFAEPLNGTSGKSPVGIRNEDTHPNDHFTVAGKELHDLNSRRTPLVISLEHTRELSPVNRVR